MIIFYIDIFFDKEVNYVIYYSVIYVNFIMEL